MQHIKRKVLQRTLECWTRVLGSGETFLFYYNTEHFLFLLTLNTTFKEKVWKHRDRCWGKDVERWGAEVVFPWQVWIFGVFILLPPMSSEETRRKVQPSVHSAASMAAPSGRSVHGSLLLLPSARVTHEANENATHAQVMLICSIFAHLAWTTVESPRLSVIYSFPGTFPGTEGLEHSYISFVTTLKRSARCWFWQEAQNVFICLQRWDLKAGAGWNCRKGGEGCREPRAGACRASQERWRAHHRTEWVLRAGSVCKSLQSLHQHWCWPSHLTTALIKPHRPEFKSQLFCLKAVTSEILTFSLVCFLPLLNGH